MTQDIKARSKEAIKPGGVNEISARRTGELLQIIKELTAREEKLVAFIESEFNRLCDDYTNDVYTHGYIDALSVVMKELGIGE